MPQDIYAEITNKIIEKLKTGTAPWQKQWTSASSYELPVNGVSGNRYHGINIPVLWIAADDKGYDCQEWATYKQWSEKKHQVRKGEKATTVVYYDTFEKEVDEKVKRIPFAKAFHVFNRCQLDGYTPEQKADKPAIEKLETVERYIQNTGAKIAYGGNRAFYSRTYDDIHLPSPDDFISTESLYSVAMHELTHWTGPEGRCSRTFGKRFGDKEYAMEELVAEMGAAFQCAALGICKEPRDDHATYIENWISVLQNDTRAIFTASSEASKAVEFLDGFQHKVISVDFTPQRA